MKAELEKIIQRRATLAGFKAADYHRLQEFFQGVMKDLSESESFNDALEAALDKKEHNPPPGDG